ncbi:hypothetical protein ASE74_14185 [Pedobacter sp. Leaf216]|nr:hypothetical protein ASE74_14185 [Pedobacter sp. Leaf216]
MLKKYLNLKSKLSFHDEDETIVFDLGLQHANANISGRCDLRAHPTITLTECDGKWKQIYISCFLIKMSIINLVIDS